MQEMHAIRYDWQRRERLEQALKPITLKQVILFAKELTQLHKHSMAVWVYGKLPFMLVQAPS